MDNNKQLTLIEALCIKENGWDSEEEKQLHDKASSLILKESQRLHLEYQIQLKEEKLRNLKAGNNDQQ